MMSVWVVRVFSMASEWTWVSGSHKKRLVIPQPPREQQLTCQHLVLAPLPPIRGSIFLMRNKSNPKTNPTTKCHQEPEAAATWEGDAVAGVGGGAVEGVGGDASGPADFTAQLLSYARGSTPRALLMLSGSCLDPVPQTSYFPGICPMVPTCRDGTLPGRRGESLQPLCPAS